ncbi:MAG: 5-formyltetrahydrofolate cyclo-ligase [Spirochaetes bacterium]|nr:5-formyltetrahydrofolate cyclo-ligase [Spirochaetota bacterium]
MKDQKQLLRKEIKVRMEKLSKRERIEKEHQIYRNLFAMAKFKKSVHILSYVSFKNEVDTKYIIQRSIEEGKKVYVPRVDEDTNELKICALSSFKELKKGYRGIPEPINEPVEKEKFDLILVPGLAFDPNGFRLGRGEGYFDKYLDKVKGFKVGLGFFLQIVEKIPVEGHDIKMNMIITEKGFIESR